MVPLDAGGSTLKLKESGDKDKLGWKWGRGPEILLADFDDPTGSDDFTLCVYVASGGPASVLVSATAPAGDEWADLEQKGFRYKDGDRTPDGVSQVQLRPGAAGKAKLKAKAKGGNLGLGSLGFGGAASVTVQLRNSQGKCYGAVYSAPFKKDDAARFVDRSD